MKGDPSPAVTSTSRLSALRRTALLDSPAEESFDRLTRLATRVLGVPVALVSLVDEQRQFFKSQCGLPEPWASRRETPLSHSFCQHVVEHAEPLVVRDAREHPLLRDNLAIRDLSVIAYAGMPLVGTDGEVLGSFCAIDTRPRDWSSDELEVLRDLAQSAMTEIELRLEVTERRAAEQARSEMAGEMERERERLLNLFMEAPAVIAFWRGPEHVLDMANPMFLRLIGYRDVLGQSARQAFPEMEGQPFFELLDRVYATGVPFTGTEFLARWGTDGHGRVTEGYFNFVFQPLFDARGGVEGILMHAVEVSEQVLARQQVEVLAAERSAILRQITDGVIVADADGRISFINDAARRIHGVAAEGVGVADYSRTYHLFTTAGEPYPDADLPLARAVLRDETVLEAEWIVRRDDGSEVIAQGSATPVRDEEGRKLGAVLVLRDVTEQRRMERQRAELMEERQRAQAQIAEIQEARGRVFTAMSHELRTPINGILGYTDLLLGDIYGELRAEQREALQRTERSARHLLELVNDILDLSKLDAGRLEIEPEWMDLAALVMEAVETVRPMAQGHSSELRVESTGPVKVATDPRRVRQILLNLLSNAAKFGAGKPVDVRCVPGADGAVVVEVADRGPGIAPEDVPRAFEEFVQLGGKQGGTGLGLPISRRLAELLGGSLGVEPRPGGGSVFRLVIPSGPPEVEPPE